MLCSNECKSAVFSNSLKDIFCDTSNEISMVLNGRGSGSGSGSGTFARFYTIFIAFLRFLLRSSRAVAAGAGPMGRGRGGELVP